MTQKWYTSNHAKLRLTERFSIPAHQDDSYVNQLRVNAVFKGEDNAPGGKTVLVYDHYKAGARLLLDKTGQTVITVKQLESIKIDGEVLLVKTVSSRITIDRITAAIKRELSRMTTQLRREIRKLMEQQAQLNVNIAELTLNKVRCKAPHTQALIQTRIDAIITQVDDLAQEIDAKLTQIKNAEREVSEVVGE